jgi:hypothetical protein
MNANLPHRALLSVGLTASCLLIAAALPACSRTPEVRATPYVAVASFQDLMTAVIDPAADGVWDAVSVTTTRSGNDVQEPRSEAEWTTVRQHAVRLVEASNLLLVEGRPVVTPGAKLPDEDVPGVNNAEQISRAFTQQRPAYVAAVQRLQAASRAALAAVDQRNPQQLLVAGDGVEKACEGCHSTFWYPGAKTPPAYPVAAASAPAARP